MWLSTRVPVREPESDTRRDLWCQRPSCYRHRQLAGAIWETSVKTAESVGDVAGRADPAFLVLPGKDRDARKWRRLLAGGDRGGGGDR